MPTRPLPAQVAFGNLIHIQARQIERWAIMLPLPSVAFQKPIDEVLRVRILANFGGQNRHLHPARTSTASWLVRRDERTAGGHGPLEYER